MFTFLKFLWDSKLITTGSGYAALLAIGYLYLFQIGPLAAEVTDVKDAVQSLQLANLEERLDAAYAALCMNPGDPAILERIRDLQQAYEEIAHKRYEQPDCSLLMKLK